MTEGLELCRVYPLGVHRKGKTISVSMVSKSDNCGIRFYDKNSGVLMKEVSLAGSSRLGNIRFTLISDINADDVMYQLFEDDRVLTDERAQIFPKRTDYGTLQCENEWMAGFIEETFDWENDRRPLIPYEECIGYCMHVRGFTMHESSGVIHKGTFRGVTEKIDYLKKLGITTLEMQPIYEFNEAELRKEYDYSKQWDGKKWVGKEIEWNKVNYWGYKKGFYYAPKSSYASSEDASKELREMIREFHKNHMEIVLQFYFPPKVMRQEILDILHYWVMVYHVDGFRIMGENLPVDIIAADAGLADTKLWVDHIDSDQIYQYEEIPKYRNLAIYSDHYMYGMRRFLKGDHGMLEEVLHHMRNNPLKCGRINYFTNYYGFTLMDLVSFNDKHNEANGESNRDGISNNESWNCGWEGPVKKKQVNILRSKQYKNAISMLFLSQATPLIFMGDEFGNSQNGNNNPYCQDNEIAWLNWEDMNKNREFFQFTCQMIEFRKKHPVLHQKEQMRMMDYYAYGYPDLSYHGEEAWLPSTGSNDRQIGILYCGKYAKINRREDDNDIYIAINMHWEQKCLALPELEEAMTWKLYYSTDEQTGADVFDNGNVRSICLPSRTVAVLISVKNNITNRKGR